MKELITSALDKAFELLEKQIPQTKKKTESVSIMDVKPTDLARFMRDNEIPDEVCFNGKDNGYDGWNDILLSWDIDVPTTEQDKMRYRVKRFTNVAWRFVYDILIKNGYKRTGYNSGLLNQFDDTTVYDMYVNKDFERLEQYYSLPFVKIN